MIRLSMCVFDIIVENGACFQLFYIWVCVIVENGACFQLSNFRCGKNLCSAKVAQVTRGLLTKGKVWLEFHYKEIIILLNTNKYKFEHS